MSFPGRIHHDVNISQRIATALHNDLHTISSRIFRHRVDMVRGPPVGHHSLGQWLYPYCRRRESRVGCWSWIENLPPSWPPLQPAVANCS